MEGELWIDKKTFQWIKVEAQSYTGLHRRLSRRGRAGTHFELEKMALEDNSGFPSISQ